MTTLDPGASDVFTHGLTSRPFSTAFRANSPAPSITHGLEVLVHEVMAAITTWPWSSSKDDPSARVTGTGCRTRSGIEPSPWGPDDPSGEPAPVIPSEADGGSL